MVFLDTLANLVDRRSHQQAQLSYDGSILKCNNTFCHGNWRVRRATSPFGSIFFSDSVMTGGNFSPVWTKGSADATCGSCHGLPPPGHAPQTLSECALCHVGVVDGAGAIVEYTKLKHINGKISVFGFERPF